MYYGAINFKKGDQRMNRDGIIILLIVSLLMTSFAPAAKTKDFQSEEIIQKLEEGETVRVASIQDTQEVLFSYQPEEKVESLGADGSKVESELSETVNANDQEENVNDQEAITTFLEQAVEIIPVEGTGRITRSPSTEGIIASTIAEEVTGVETSPRAWGEVEVIDEADIEGYRVFRGGQELEEVEFVELIGETELARDLRAEVEEYEQDLREYEEASFRTLREVSSYSLGFTSFISGLSFLGALTVIISPEEEEHREGAVSLAKVFGSITLGSGFLANQIAPPSEPDPVEQRLDYYEANQLAQIYNRELMDELGLSEEEVVRYLD